MAYFSIGDSIRVTAKNSFATMLRDRHIVLEEGNSVDLIMEFQEDCMVLMSLVDTGVAHVEVLNNNQK